MTAEFEARLREAAEGVEIAAACRLVARVAVQPLLDTWRRHYPRVPAKLEDHLKAQSEFVAIMALAEVLGRLAAEAPEGVGGQGIVEQLLAQAEQELARAQEQGPDLE